MHVKPHLCAGCRSVHAAQDSPLRARQRLEVRSWTGGGCASGASYLDNCGVTGRRLDAQLCGLLDWLRNRNTPQAGSCVEEDADAAVDDAGAGPADIARRPLGGPGSPGLVASPAYPLAHKRCEPQAGCRRLSQDEGSVDVGGV